MIRKEISFVLRLIDDFNAKDITGLAQSFYIKSFPIKPIYKPEGYYVFINCDINDDLTIVTVNYKTKILPKEVIKNSNNSVVWVRLYRKPLGIFTDCRMIKGVDLSNKLTYTSFREVAGLSLSKSEVKDGKTVIYLSGYSTENLVGGCYAVKEGNSTQLFYIIGKTSAAGYEIAGTKPRSHQSKQKLFRVYSDYSDKEGNYNIPVELNELDKVPKISTVKDIKRDWGCYYE